MKTIILAGGFGTRLAEYTDIVPKPMVNIGGYPILWHIMNHYSKFSYNEFCIALGYKAEVIKQYFINYRSINSDLSVNLSNGDLEFFNATSVDWKVELINTGLNTSTGGRLKRLKKYIGKERFLLTYGDGLSDININELIDFHISHGKIATVTAVHPSARFGELLIENQNVIQFKEKPQLQEGWINGGFFVLEPEFLDFIKDDGTMLEDEPLSYAARNGELMAFKHNGFWQCMDTKRDKDLLEKMCKDNNTPWA